jgi:hypothetical protein
MPKGSLLTLFGFCACFGFFTLPLFRVRASPVVSYMPTAAFEDDGHGSEQFAGGSPTLIAFDFRSLIHSVKDFKGVPTSVAVVVVNWHSKPHLR